MYVKGINMTTREHDVKPLTAEAKRKICLLRLPQPIVRMVAWKGKKKKSDGTKLKIKKQYLFFRSLNASKRNIDVKGMRQSP